MTGTVAQAGDPVDIEVLCPAVDAPDADAYLCGDVRLPQAMVAHQDNSDSFGPRRPAAFFMNLRQRPGG